MGYPGLPATLDQEQRPRADRRNDVLYLVRAVGEWVVGPLWRKWIRPELEAILTAVSFGFFQNDRFAHAETALYYIHRELNQKYVERTFGMAPPEWAPHYWDMSVGDVGRVLEVLCGRCLA